VSVTWRDLHAEAADRTSDVEARWLVEALTALDRSRWSEPAPPDGAARLNALVERRRAGEPLQYVLGRWAFRGLDLLVDPRALIPRPETEVVAEVAIAEARGLHLPPPRHARGLHLPPRRHPGPCVVADLGTGSGALALALADELPEADVWATDVSPAALAVARANLAAVGPSVAARVHFAEGMWYEALPACLRGRLRVIVSNPPYVTEAEFAGLPPEVRDHEPVGALVAGPTGRESLEHLVAGGLDWLEPGGALVLELAPDQAAPLRAAAEAAGYEAVAVHTDLAGRDRVLVAHRPPETRRPPEAGA
jgi:release factor glutamine methyltransferase